MGNDKKSTDELIRDLEEQAAELDKQTQSTKGFGTVIRVDKRGVVVVGNGGPQLMAPNRDVKVAVGDVVLMGQFSGIEAVVDHLPCGDVVVVDRVRDNKRIDVSIGGNIRTILMKDGITLKEGDEVLLDFQKHVVIEKLPEVKQRFAVETDTQVTWADIGGQAEAKLALREAIELPLQHKEIYKAYGKRAAKGILLSGPPGCGKTMLGKAAASSIAAMTKSKSAFLYVKGPEILDPYVGMAEASVRNLFQKAREHKKKHGSAAVIFVDEADAILGRRGGRGSFMEKTIVPTFLTEMDWLEESGALVILATNRPDTLDPAIVRDGRMDRRITIKRPNAEDSEAISKLYLAKVPLGKGLTVTIAAQGLTESIFDPRQTIRTVYKGRKVDLPLGATVSGALIAGVIGRAVSFALHRDIQAGHKASSGLSTDDLRAAAKQTVEESATTDHSDAIRDFLGLGERYEAEGA